jgi:pilus assembly protein Flp/PilA
MAAYKSAVRQFAVLVRTLLTGGEKGATATEYSLLVGLIALVIVIGVTAFGANLNAFFGGLATTVGGW